ncbi:hypothetical protein BN2476_80023 [Paraburkholderia piptadeniae]|uniref:Uncharacterized protein n=1 Tax=Paraburkholderia piptadeniae TaxID=1701573 RepID=A0A1N7RLN9_9BURK|nr:hypothetical protein BN2476_80023 [Paraburkholderia piptadeniae]
MLTHPVRRDAPPASRRLLHEAETIEYIKLIKSSYSIVFNKIPPWVAEIRHNKWEESCSHLRRR